MTPQREHYELIIYLIIQEVVLLSSPLRLTFSCLFLSLSDSLLLRGFIIKWKQGQIYSAVWSRGRAGCFSAAGSAEREVEDDLLFVY